MSRHTQENIVILIILGFFTAVLVTSLDFSPRARLVPIPIATLGIVLGVVQLIWQNLQSDEELNIDLLEFLTKGNSGPAAQEQLPEETLPSSDSGSSNLQGRPVTHALGMVAGFVSIILLIGPMPSIYIFTATYFILSKHYTKPMSLIYALIFSISVYLLFVVGLELQLYHGIFQPTVDWYYETF
ncbi:MAG: tripartite tricarboxylate transporter TctB family protein [Rhodospirillales bacterium]|jgi:hypothetical protein|nr:tripartite tricarboxylate transporter TctB family protein [Rhodospirillales bacterium]MBT5033935.1 tripartite tricarboxylate transporter TctB family protein [Rhodospirillaceae bacterium]MBT6222016.1 tripartite tricarboxylate transporter TctB family protein [Rhodospirillaceae bacterium]MBT7487430.1 tripartite tricarboxylate transporter TctB family protein [Rhodospirillales bacterium]MBT7770695.1 tripartite tricarboxylate transporter TctB family protein [Rhodospirillales bacterium]